MSSQYREQKQMGTYSYSTLDNTNKFSCTQYCTCRNIDERSQYDIDMHNKYVNDNINISCKIHGCACNDCH